MSVTKANPTMTRRGFMKNAVVVGGVAAAAAVTHEVDAGMQSEPPVDPAPEANLGYRETPHVRQYYQKARF